MTHLRITELLLLFGMRTPDCSPPIEVRGRPSGCEAMERFVRLRCTWAEIEFGTQTSIRATNNTETRSPSRSGDWQYCLTRSRVHVSVGRQFIVTFFNVSKKWFKAGHGLTAPQHHVIATGCPVAALRWFAWASSGKIYDDGLKRQTNV